MEKVNGPGCSVSTTTLTIVFVVLKLCNVINWSWWWVLSPTWISMAVMAFGIIFAGYLKEKYKQPWD